MCRERALSDPERAKFWLANADEWGRRALDEIAPVIRGRGRGLAVIPD